VDAWEFWRGMEWAFSIWDSVDAGFNALLVLGASGYLSVIVFGFIRRHL